MFIDASAIVAMLLAEPDSDHLAEKVERAPTKVTSAIAIWESITRLSRDHDPKVARHRVFKLLDDAGASVVTIGTEEARIASLARDRYGSGKYGLNMGDCFAYACAKANNVPLLYVGNDFPKTDVNDGYTL